VIALTVRRFTAKLTNYSSGKSLKIDEIPFREAQRIYEEQAKDKLPLTEKEFREVISAEYMVFGRKGLGGPQIEETRRALAIASNHTQKNIDWPSNLNRPLFPRYRGRFTIVRPRRSRRLVPLNGIISPPRTAGRAIIRGCDRHLVSLSATTYSSTSPPA
jgi:hypothetical protein